MILGLSGLILRGRRVVEGVAGRDGGHVGLNKVSVVLEEGRDELVQRSHILCSVLCLWEKTMTDGKKERRVGNNPHE